MVRGVFFCIFCPSIHLVHVMCCPFGSRHLPRSSSPSCEDQESGLLGWPSWQDYQGVRSFVWDQNRYTRFKLYLARNAGKNKLGTCLLGLPNFFWKIASNSTVEFGSKLKCMSIFFTFGHHLTTPLGLQKFAISVVIGLKPQIYAAQEAWSDDAQM